MLLNIFKKSLKHTCYSYTVLVLLYLFIMLGMFRTSANPYPLTLIMMFPFCFFFALANSLITETSMRGTAKLLVHFLIVTADLVFLLWLPFRGPMSDSTSLVLFVLYLVVYTVGTLIVTRILSTRKKKTESKIEYKRVYGDPNRK